MKEIEKLPYNDLIVEVRQVKDELLNAEAKVLELKAKQHAINTRIRYLKQKGHTLEVFITDHCLLRYLERVEGVDVATYRRKLGNDLRKVLKNTPAGVGAKGIKLNGMTFKLDGNAVTTIV